MDATTAAIELSEAAWEQWIGAALRAERLRQLAASARRQRGARRPAPARPRASGRLWWLLAISAAGFLLLR